MEIEAEYRGEKLVKFYVVIRDKDHHLIRHNRTEAIEEAKRLARKEQDLFYVLGTVRAFVVEEQPVVEIRFFEGDENEFRP